MRFAGKVLEYLAFGMQQLYPYSVCDEQGMVCKIRLDSAFIRESYRRYPLSFQSHLHEWSELAHTNCIANQSL